MNVKASTEELLELILSAVNDLVDFELAVILRLRNEKMLEVEKATGPLVTDEIRTYHIDLNQRTDLARIMTVNEPYLFDESEDHMDTYEEVLELPEGHSCLVVPLYVKTTAIGLLTLDHSVCGKFTPTIVKFIGTLSKLIAVLIAQNDSSVYLNALSKNLTKERNILLKKTSSEFQYMIGESKAWELVKEKVQIVAESELPVLVQGETGTGKEQVARTLHLLSSRRNAPFITLNCSALNASLAESELFGHERGAFTSAVAQRRGRFEMADGGTLFLDEIADLPPEIQPKLLRTLQEGTYERVGGEKTLHADVRIIAASNKDLRDEVEAGRFREDLFYRLGVFPIYLPPLRERQDDIILLAKHFLQTMKQDKSFSNDALNCLTSYPWKGNVRELQNVISRASLVAGDDIIGCEHLGLQTIKPVKTANEVVFKTLVDMEISHIQKALELCEGKIYGDQGAAKLLGMKPTTLQSRIKKHGI